VLVHRPGDELRRLTPANRTDLLFDDVVWVERAAEEHDAFTAALRAQSVEVLYLEELLVETLSASDARTHIIDATIPSLSLGPTLAPQLELWLGSLPGRDLARKLIGGVTFGELPFHTSSFVALAEGSDAFAVPPLPNHLFARDPSSWAFDGVSVHAMATPARRREALHVELIYRQHPLFQDTEPRFWSDGLDRGAPLEGGDILVLGNGCLLVGLSERSSPAAVESYAARLFAAGVADQVIVVTLPRSRSTIHLDTVMTMVDRDAFVVFAPLLDRLEAFTLWPERACVRSRPEPDLFAAVAKGLGLPRVRLIHCDADHLTVQREQWDEAHNLLAISPGVVIAYERNTATNARLAEHGLEVIPVPGSELARGRGGPRCMSCPIERDDV
jgi:arginine deiminase